MWTVCKVNPLPRSNFFILILSPVAKFSNAHFLSMCLRFPTVESKLKQYKVKMLRCLCASPRHLSDDCRRNRGELKPCKICKKGAHYGSLCPDKDKASSPSLSVSSARSEKELLLLLVKVTVSKNGHK